MKIRMDAKGMDLHLLGGSTSCYSAARQMLFVAMLFLNA